MKARGKSAVEKTINKLMNYDWERLQNVSLHAWKPPFDNGKRRLCHLRKQTKRVRSLSQVKGLYKSSVNQWGTGREEMWHTLWKKVPCISVLLCVIFHNISAGFVTVKQWVISNRYNLATANDEDSCLSLRWRFKLLSNTNLVQTGLIQQNVIFLSCSSSCASTQNCSCSCFVFSRN